MADDRRPRTGSVLRILGLAAAAVCLAAATPRASEAVLIGHGVSDQAGSAVGGAADPATSAPGSVKYQFSISGGLGGLFPGASLPLVLHVHNPTRARITVTSITTAVGDASASCPAADLGIAPFSGALSIGPGQTASVTVLAQMSHAAPDTCQGADFPLQYTGQGRGS